MSESTSSDLDRLADLLRALPPVPAGWVAAAQQLPVARAQLDELVARSEADAAFRQALLADLEQAVAAAGFDPHPQLLRALRERFRAA